jgi:regulation of enolase protein 1 (concanavalin A-like superfamily)
MKSIRVGLVLAVLAVSMTGTTVAAEQERLLLAECFDGKLAPGWSWVREDAKGWRFDGASLVVRTSTGGLWMKDNNTQNILLRTPPETKEGVLVIEVFVENEPTNAYEHAGLVWYYDDDNYVVLLKEKVGDKQIVQLVFEKEGRPKVGFAEKPFAGKGVWLRMVMSDGKIRGQFRATEKDEWQTLGQCDLPVKGEPRVGLITGYAPKNMEHQVRFRDFRLLRAAK